jgi:hypothetical protein
MGGPFVRGYGDIALHDAQYRRGYRRTNSEQKVLISAAAEKSP